MCMYLPVCMSMYIMNVFSSKVFIWRNSLFQHRAITDKSLRSYLIEKKLRERLDESLARIDRVKHGDPMDRKSPVIPAPTIYDSPGSSLICGLNYANPYVLYYK